jgi:hypothetical protein
MVILFGLAWNWVSFRFLPGIARGVVWDFKAKLIDRKVKGKSAV